MKYLWFYSCFIITLAICKEIKITDECEFHVTIQREIESDGFHRQIHSLVEFLGGYGIIQRQHCFLALKENLPSGLYVSPDQLEDLARLGQVQACVDRRIDTEAPEPMSTNISVMVYSSLERAENLLFARLALPVHARYHLPSSDGGYQPIKINSPDLFLRCPGRFNCPGIHTVSLPCYACSEEICTWSQISYKTNAESLKMLVPVGNMQHYYLVTFLTFAITSGGAIYILSVMANNVFSVL